MKVLIACEESQTVCIEFRKLGHEAYSADVQKPSGGHPEWHILGDVIPIVNGNCEFTTMDGVEHKIKGRWDLIIAHPPCTYLTVTGNRWFDVEKYGEKAKKRWENRRKAMDFFMLFANSDCPKVAIENPVGVMSTYYRKPDQIIQPYEFGHPHTKRTCLWLKGLKPLTKTCILERPKSGWENMQYDSEGRNLSFATRDENGKLMKWNDPITAKIRSKTYPGIAKAMAEQWGGKIMANKVVIGIDQSYKRTGISVLKNKEVVRMYSVDFEDCENNTDKRNMLYGYMERILKKACSKQNKVIVITERIRLRSQNFLSENYIKATGALVATVIDVCTLYGVPVYSVDSRAWKSAIVGTSRPMDNKYGINPEKYPTILYMRRKGLLEPLLIPYHGKGKKGIIPVRVHGEHALYEVNDDLADSYCIALYGFLPENRQKLKEEQF